MTTNSKILPSLALFTILAACGGGTEKANTSPGVTTSSGGAATQDVSVIESVPQTSKVNPASIDNQSAAPSNVTLNAPVIDLLEVAQTHVLPAEGKSWSSAGLQVKNFHLTAEREALVLVKLSSPLGVVSSPLLEVFNGAQSLGQVVLNTPATLPPTESNGTAYSTTSHWAKIDKAWVKPGLTVQVVNSAKERSASKAINVGPRTAFTIFTLPFYVFGVSETAAPFSQTAAPDQATKDEYFAKHPISDIQMVNHPAGKITWPYLIVKPRKGFAAQKVIYKEQQNDGFAVMSAVLDVLRTMRNANGDNSMNIQYYAPLIMATQSGQYGPPGGGLGGSDVGTGDFDYTGIFIHEAGHAFGMPHANEGFVGGTYPYISGSLSGSTWGFDQKRNEFLNTLVPATASTFKTCLNGTPTGRQFDALSRCIKQDPMASGAGDQTPNSKYTMFSDYNAGVVQNYLEGTTTLTNGKYVYTAGKTILDSTSNTGYSRWNTIEKRYVPVETKTISAGLYGLDNILPYQRDVAVHAIVFTAGISSIVERIDATQLNYDDIVTYDAALTQIYPPVSYTGNLRRLIDPTDAAQLASIQPTVGATKGGVNDWFCKNAGCDYTLKVTFTDNSVQYTVVQAGFRGWFDNALAPGVQDPLSESSFKVWAVNVPATKAIKLIELLETPEVYKGFPANPRIIANRVVN
jgi:Peptidase M66